MAGSIRINPLHAPNIAPVKMPGMKPPAQISSRVGGMLHSYLGHFAQPNVLNAGHNTSGHFIAKATANAHGQFRAKARAAGMSTAAFASKEAGAPGKLGKQARLAKTLMGFNK